MVGGFAGYAGGSSSGNIIENCYAYGEVIGEESVGGFAEQFTAINSIA